MLMKLHILIHLWGVVQAIDEGTEAMGRSDKAGVCQT